MRGWGEVVAPFPRMDWAGFEPAASTMPTWRSYQPDLPALRHSKHKKNQFKHYATAFVKTGIIAELMKYYVERTVMKLGSYQALRLAFTLIKQLIDMPQAKATFAFAKYTNFGCVN